MEIIHGNWRYEAVFRAVKTELLLPVEMNKQKMREEMDLLENHVLSYGIQGTKWTKAERWRYRRFYSLDDDFVVTDEEKQMGEKLNGLRQHRCKTYFSFAKKAKTKQNRTRSCRSAVSLLRGFAHT